MKPEGRPLNLDVSQTPRDPPVDWTFDHDLTTTEPWELLLYLRGIIPENMAEVFRLVNYSNLPRSIAVMSLGMVFGIGLVGMTEFGIGRSC